MLSGRISYSTPKPIALTRGIEAMTSAGVGARFMSPQRTRETTTVSGSGAVTVSHGFFIGRQDGATTVPAVLFRTYARPGLRKGFTSTSESLRLGTTLRLRVTDPAGRDIPFGATVDNAGCLRSRGDTITTDHGLFAAFYHLDPAADATVRVTSTGLGYTPASVKLTAGKGLLQPGRRSEMVVVLEKPAPNRPQWSADQMRTPLFSGDSSRPVVYLTFDDGLNSRATADVLASLGVKASFCLPGYVVAGDTSLVKYLLDRGEAICNHTYHHYNPATVDDATLTAEITSSEAAIAAGGGSAKPFFRPPEGGFTAHSLDVIASLGYRNIIWNVDPRDWACEVDTSGLIARVLDHVTWGSIVVMHSFGCVTNAALPGIVSGLRARGYSFETFNQLPSSKELRRVRARRPAAVRGAGRAQTRTGRVPRTAPRTRSERRLRTASP